MMRTNKTPSRTIPLVITQEQERQIKELLTLKDSTGYQLFENRSHLVRAGISILAETHKEQIKQRRKDAIESL